MGQHVALAQQRQRFLAAGRRVVQMTHHRQAGGIRHFQRDFQRGGALAAAGGHADPHLDAANDIAVFLDRVQAGFGMQQAEIGAFADHYHLGEGEDAGKRDVDIADDVHVRRLDDMPAVAVEIRWARRAGIHQRRAGCRQRIGIGFDADAGVAGIDVGVQVDQAGRHHLAGNVAGVTAFQPVTDGGDLAVVKRDVGDAVDILSGIDDATALQHQIMHATVSLLPWISARPGARAARNPNRIARPRQRTKRSQAPGLPRSAASPQAPG